MNKKFIDLFCGIGGFRLGFESQGFKCVFSSDINEHARKMYDLNFNDMPHGDITKINECEIPDHDILLGGFPCQAFSIGGLQKGFEDKTRGTLFFEILRIASRKKPEVIILENVDNLEKHDKGNTFKIIKSSLENIGYTVCYKVLSARSFGVPQNRKRIIIVASRTGKYFDFSKLKETTINSMLPFLDENNNFEYLHESEYTLIKDTKLQASGLIFAGYRNKKMREKGARADAVHLSRNHKQPNRIYSSEGLNPTLSSQEASGRYFILIDNKVRKLTLEECYRFMGFPDDFKKIGSKTNLYQRVGNSVCVPMMKEIAKEVKNQLF